MDSKNIEKAEKARNFLAKNSHKLDFLVGVGLISYGVYGYLNDYQYSLLAISAGVLSFVLAFFKPVQRFNDHINKKIVNKKDD